MSENRQTNLFIAPDKVAAVFWQGRVAIHDMHGETALKGGENAGLPFLIIRIEAIYQRPQFFCLEARLRN